VLVKMSPRGTITIPRPLREGLSQETLLEATRRDDGVIELHPRTVVDATQAWFWTERWQRMEREADEDIAAGYVESFPDADSFIQRLSEVPRSEGKEPIAD